MELGTQYRTKLMNQISEADINAEMKIAGWVENIRDHGGVSFIDLRDMYGVMQVVMRDTKDGYALFLKIPNHFQEKINVIRTHKCNRLIQNQQIRILEIKL